MNPSFTESALIGPISGALMYRDGHDGDVALGVVSRFVTDHAPGDLRDARRHDPVGERLERRHRLGWPPEGVHIVLRREKRIAAPDEPDVSGDHSADRRCDRVHRSV